MATAKGPAPAPVCASAALSQNLAPYGPRVNLSPSPVLITGCMKCGQKHQLYTCGGCKVVRYCGPGCQVADRPAHKTYCNEIKEGRQILEEEEAILAGLLGEEPENIFFGELRGHFWRVDETHSYIHARGYFVDHLLKVNTGQAVGCALEHLLEMQQLCHGDLFGTNKLVPALYLRLDRDQDCYDFCKWWATTGLGAVDELGIAELPFLNISNANVFESAKLFTDGCPFLCIIVAITLLKIRLLTDLQSLHLAKREAGPHVPQEILDIICKHSVRSFTAADGELLKTKDHTGHIKTMKKQSRELYSAVNRVNKHFWPALLEPGNNLPARSPVRGLRRRGWDADDLRILLQCLGGDAWSHWGDRSFVKEVGKYATPESRRPL